MSQFFPSFSFVHPLIVVTSTTQGPGMRGSRTPAIKTGGYKVKEINTKHRHKPTREFIRDAEDAKSSCCLIEAIVKLEAGHVNIQRYQQYQQTVLVQQKLAGLH